MNNLSDVLSSWNVDNAFPRVVGSEVSRDDVIETISEIFTPSTVDIRGLIYFA
jgi:hypothetical protein